MIEEVATLLRYSYALKLTTCCTCYEKLSSTEIDEMNLAR